MAKYILIPINPDNFNEKLKMLSIVGTATSESEDYKLLTITSEDMGNMF